MLKKDRWFLMPYEYCHNDYREAIKNNDLSSLIRIFYDIELVKKEKKPCLLSRNANKKLIMGNSGRTKINSLIAGPGGFRGVESVWEGNKLITFMFFGG